MIRGRTEDCSHGILMLRLTDENLTTSRKRKHYEMELVDEDAACEPTAPK